jgi:hypothetical protein
MKHQIQPGSSTELDQFINVYLLEMGFLLNEFGLGRDNFEKIFTSIEAFPTIGTRAIKHSPVLMPDRELPWNWAKASQDSAAVLNKMFNNEPQKHVSILITFDAQKRKIISVEGEVL